MNLIKTTGKVNKWNLDLGAISRIWKGGCIIRAVFLDRIKAAYDRNPELNSLLIDPEFAAELNERQAAWRRIVAVSFLLYIDLIFLACCTARSLNPCFLCVIGLLRFLSP